MDYPQPLESINEQKADTPIIETYEQSRKFFGLQDPNSNSDNSELENLLQHNRISDRRRGSVPTHSPSDSRIRLARMLRSKSAGYGSNSSGNSHPHSQISNRSRFMSRRRSTITQLQTPLPLHPSMPTLTRLFSSEMLLGSKMQSRKLIQEVPLPSDETPIPPQFDVVEAIDKMGMGKFQWTLYVILGFVSFAYGMEIMLIAFLLPILQRDFEISALESTLVPLSSIIGAFLGSFVLSLLADKFGRKKVIIVGVVCTAVSAVVSAFATDIYQESVARFFVGFFMKCGVVAITLFAEFLPTVNRGKVLMLAQLFWTLGLMSSVGLAWLTLEYLNWRWYVKLSTIPLWIAAIGVLWKMPESAHYLITAGQTDECLEILQQISAVNGKALPDGDLLPVDPNMEHPEVSVWNSVLLLIVYVIYQCCYYGIIFVSVRYFAKLDSIFHLHHSMYWEMILTTAAEIPAIGIGYFLVDQGRALTMSVSLFLFAIPTYLLVFMDFEFSQALGLTLLFCSRMFISVCGMGAGVYFLEYYPTHMRATALGSAVSISMIVKFGAIVIAEVLHVMIAMYIFGTLGIIAFVASLMLEIDWRETWFLLD